MALSKRMPSQVKSNLTLLFIIFCTIIGSSNAAWNRPPFFAPNSVTADVNFLGFDETSKRTRIALKEEIPEPISIALINYEGTESPQIGTVEDGKSNFMLGAEVRLAAGVWSIWITKRQDYETPMMQNYRFFIVIGNEQYPIALNIVNIDDNAPLLQANERTCEIEENYSGQTNCTYSVSDADGWIDDVNIDLSSMSEEVSLNFQITDDEKISDYQKIIRLVVVVPLDFETFPVYMHLLTATDGAKNQGTLTTVVQVLDMPDEPPKWIRITAAENILEKTSHTFAVSARDGDIQINAEINYKIIAEIESEKKYFDVESTTGLVTVNPIDRDKLKKEVFRFLIVAYEKLDITSAINSTVLIILEDKNDHEPVVSPAVLSIDIKEETYMTLEFQEPIVVTDPDLAQNGQFSVSLIDDSEHNWSSAFLIVPNDGYQTCNFTITVVNASLLDYEDKNWRSINIEIQAIEVADSSHIGKRSLIINLINWNDEMPIFKTPSVVKEIREDVKMNHFIAEMLATDRDVDDNVTHSIVSQKVLKIDEKTGVVVTAQDDALDYESIPVVIVQILATDLAQHVAYATLTIEVIDVNDTPPQLYLPKQIPSLIEEVENGTRVDAQIKASDLDTEAVLIFSIDWDKTTAHKQSVRVSENHYREHLEIITDYPEGNTREATGILRVRGRIDYEAFDVLFLVIVVLDVTTVHNENSTFASLAININDINDNYPIFNEFEDMSVSENQVMDTPLGAVTATDADGPEFNQVSYYIEPINKTEDGLIKIDQVSGIIRVDLDKQIDAEKYEYIYYRITASDGELLTTMSLKIYVNDMNDEEPHLSPEKIFNSTIHIMEKSPNGTEIYKIVGKDNDRTHPFNNVSYLLNANHSASFQYFDLTRFTGLLRVQLADGYQLDRDFGAPSHTISIKLRDNYLVDGITWNTNTFDTTMTIILDDINDQIPKLPDLGDPAKIVTENTKKDSLILVIEAQDFDDPQTENTKVTYQLLSQSRIDDEIDEDCEEPFRVVTENLKQAHVFSVRDLKGCFGFWALEVYAQDRGTYPGPLNDTRTYHIKISDYNYYDPVIELPSEAGSGIALSQEQSLHSRLKTYDKQLLPNFRASDRDSGASGTVTFSLSSLNGDDEFFEVVELSNNEGQLQLKTWPANIEENSKFKVILVATDGGDPPRSISQDHTIMFVSTEGPKFNDNEWTVWIKENKTGLDFSAIIPEAFDDVNDGGGNFVPIYYFLDDKIGDFEYFILNISTRELTVKKELDREAKEIMWVNVITTADRNGPSRDPRKQAILNITIIVLDENDNPPIFESKLYSAGVAGGDSVDRIVLTVRAIDADLNDTLSYSIIEGTLTSSDSSLVGLINPFLLDRNTGELFLKFSVTSNMVGFFKFEILVNDAVDHTDMAIIQIYIVSQTNRVVFTFQNNAANIIEEREFLKKIFSNVFGYLCNIDSIKSSVDSNDHVMDNVSDVMTHFINSDDNLPIGSEIIVRLSSDLKTVSNLRASLQARSLFLLDVPTGSSPEPSDNQETIHWILVSLSIFFGFSTVALLIVYFLRTRSLAERLDKMAISWRTNDGNEKINPPVVTPGTNQFAIAGLNPIWNTTKSMERYLDDSISQGSGDSELIGIEDSINFSYKNNVNSLEKEMEARQVSCPKSNAPIFHLEQAWLNDEFYEDKC